jgi:peptidoglycan/LPS O-acetylase OafA/YrhL
MNSTAPVLPAQTLPATIPLAPLASAEQSQESTNLDFLRSFAVLLVFFGHLSFFHQLLTLGPLNLSLMGGLGVMFFFVHTALVLMLSLERQQKEQGDDRLFMSFMIRRCFRIYPLSIAAVLLVVAFHLPLTTVSYWHFQGIKPDGGDVFSNLFLVQNFSSRVSILGPMWSLPFEMDMYVFLPWLYLLLRPNRSIRRIALVWIIAVAFNLFYIRYVNNPSFLGFVPCFLAGVLAYQLQRSNYRRRLPAFLWPLVVAMLAAFFLVDGLGEHWVKKWTTCLFLGLAVPFFSRVSASWLVVASHFIAKYSYGIYLTHFFCIWFAFERLGNLPALAKIPLFVALAVGLPILFYHLLEEPLIRAGKRVAKTYARAPRSSNAVSPPLPAPNARSSRPQSG